MIKKYLFFTTCALSLLGGCSLFQSDEDIDYTGGGSYYVGEPYSIKGVLYTPKEDMEYSEKGFATWYTKPEDDRITTNGELFDDNELTAAHKTLPLPSLVRITNLENGNTAVVRVNDRGPSVNNRLIDVSRKAAEALELPENGTTMVQVDILPIQSKRLKEMLPPYQEEKSEQNDETTAVIPVGSTEPIYQAADHSQTEIYSSEPKTAPKGPLPPTKSYMIQIGAFGKEENVKRVLNTLNDMTTTTQKQGNLTIVTTGPFASEAEAKAALAKIKQNGYADAWLKVVK